MKDLGRECNRMPGHSRCLRMKKMGKCPAGEFEGKCLNRHRFGNDVVASREITGIALQAANLL